MEQLNIYSCSNCGVEVISNKKVEKCYYCNSNNILVHEMENNIVPNYYLPFKINNNEAKKILKNYYKRKVAALIPKQFKNKSIINCIQGVYIPVWYYNYTASGTVEVLGKKVNNFKTSNVKYEKIDDYLLNLDINCDFEYLPIIATKYIDSNIIDNIGPYNMKNIKNYDYNKFDYIVEKYSLNNDYCINISEQKIKKLIEKKVLEQEKNYKFCEVQNSNINLKLKNISCVLVPIYILNIKYKDKIYSIYINGESGNIYSEIKFNKKFLIVIFIISFIALFSILFMICYLRWFR